ncbi:RagB/SusD family nutrient uptake outer membrane protein [Sphingobacterium griseoflavum]|uniref:Carbohydrate-binding protein n=1 Tax=Sphingobacterium griseoflavum TaxID=1474952 RepID=A0ABQ3HT98_9SPHI|nr:RagB/SusD family nutrient uptake outer membrane protein [Sphingobacterium griseoflavum]GHE32190.1 carbohydrate-binding protein [Sphingobacterium griseoflavum]
MKTIYSVVVRLFIAVPVFFGSCRKDLLDQQATTELDAKVFWQNEADATSGLMGMYANIKPLFNKDYFYDGMGEYVRTRSVSSLSSGTFTAGLAYYTGNANGHYNPHGYGSAFDNMYRFLFGGVNRANYVIDNVTKMLPRYPASVENLEIIIAEAKMMKALVYFRLISMWGDVPYLDETITDNAQVAEIARTPIEEIKNRILADLDYAIEKLPITPLQPDRMSRPAALALRGKVNLFWGSWNKHGWPELDTFEPSSSKAEAAFRAAAVDFKRVITEFGLTLFRNGEPGETDALGKADKLPNYYYLFLPTANNANENLIGFTHGGIGSGLSEKMMRDFGNRDTENAEVNISPSYWIADRYQSTITGDFLPEMVRLNPNNVPDARTRTNSALNPQSYANRDYRMKATIVWEYEVMQGMTALQSTRFFPMVYQNQGGVVNIGGQQFTTIRYNSGTNSGLLFRKFVRNYPGQGREEGNYTWPVIRLADVYLMYAEASNEAYGPQPDAVDLVNKIRARGNLPGLKPEKYADRTTFFDAIEQERIIELVGEGHRFFDIRRWRKIEAFWGEPYGPGRTTTNSWGNSVTTYFQNASERVYQQCYILRIPESERDRNPNLTQNWPFL